MFRSKGVFTLVVVLGLGVFGMGCGDDGASQQDIDNAIKQERQAQKLKEIQQGITALKKQKKQDNFKQKTTPVPPSSAPAYTGSGPAKTCSNGIGASSATTCDFAYNVAGEYGSNPGASTINAFSPVTGQDYTMTCSAWSGGGTVCRGGNDAAVFIP